MLGRRKKYSKSLIVLRRFAAARISIEVREVHVDYAVEVIFEILSITRTLLLFVLSLLRQHFRNQFFPSTTDRSNHHHLLSSAKLRLREVAIDPSSDTHSSAFSVHIPRPIPISSHHTDITSYANQFNPAFIYPSVHLPCGQTRTDYLPSNDSQQVLTLSSFHIYIFLLSWFRSQCHHWPTSIKLRGITVYYQVKRLGNRKRGQPDAVVACIAQKHAAISPVAPIAAAEFNPSLMCLPALFDHFGGEILRTHMNPAATQFKPIPNNERVDLTRFLSKEPQEWTMGDVIAWLLHVARRNNIPFEDLEMQKFANCTGMVLIQMREIDFKQRDAVYGSLLHAEFRKLLAEERSTDEYSYKSPEKASTSRVPDDTRVSCTNSGLSVNASSLLMSDSSASMQPSDTLSQVNTDIIGTFNFNSPVGSDETFMLRPTYCKVRKNKDGRPRKHSQHSKGNKLWEFIRDALKDPSTCPSVVRWEDPAEGVFRIVESERLAQLWGERKNNQKMTYEKLSRAMRTYYEKRILVPVPKTGLYPKKLVYKFGPSALS
ncbi:unnamed protein product [Cercopithifilaria johnstoni]|uniref:Uncharacterized protein n=1 Tax=Cercopithifilaria johnstoni TaxID=2874296 RepID=A0A8J2LW74_9BILA|nr:unnamed protein product [Cercopithifilaria johnstoni]